MPTANLPASRRKLVELEMQLVAAFVATSNVSRRQAELDTTRLFVEQLEHHEGSERYGDRLLIIREIHELSQELAIVSAFRVAELNINRLSRWLSKTYTNYTWPSFSQLLVNRTGVSLLAIAGARGVDELRLLNNAVKHRGKVTQALAAYPNWVAGERLQRLDQALERLGPSIPVFIEDLAKNVLPVKLGGLRPNHDVFPVHKVP